MSSSLSQIRYYSVKGSLGVLILLISFSNAYNNPSNCNTSTQYYNILSLQCTACPSNTQTASDKTFCNCTNSYYKNWEIIGFNHADSCKSLGSSYDKTTEILSLYDQNGAMSPTAVTCSGIGYSNTANDQCIPCGYDSKMTYDSSLGSCQCTSGYIKIGQSCYQNSLTGWTRNFSITDKFNYLAQQRVKIGCQQQNLAQPCNMLINMCVRADYSSTNYFCSLLSNLSAASQNYLPNYKFSSKVTDSIGIYASSILGVNTTTVKNQLDIFTIQYNIHGQILDISVISKQIFQCAVTEQDVAKFSSFGLNLYKYCSSKRTFSSESYYDFYVKTSDGEYAQIPILINGNYYKRISPSSSSGSHTFKLEFISQPPLLVPILIFSDSSSSSIQTISNSSQISINTLAPFIVFNIGILIAFVIVFYRHIQYNPSQEINDPYFLCKGAVTFLFKLAYCWGYGLWIWLLGLSIYMFAFYKFQQTIYLILPDQDTEWNTVYFFFMLIFYVQLVLVVLSIAKLIYDLSEIDYFLIDWEKEKDTRKFQVGGERKEVSVWRKVLIVNQLYELAIRQNINIYFVTLFSLLFLRGLQWINLAYSLPNTSNLASMSSTSSSENISLAYCIITFVFFIIGAIQFIVRNIIRIWLPLPAQNFVDLCAVSNISILIFNEALHGYYIHGVNPMGQSQGNLNFIQNMFEKQAKSFGKSRGFHLEDPDICQTFEVVLPIHIRRAFQIKYKSLFLQKLIPKNYQNQSVLSNPLPQDLDDNDYDQLQQISLNMVQNFKMYLESVKSSILNLRERSWWEKLISCPVSQDAIGKVPIFFKDKWNDFTNAFLSGHQFIFLFNFINFVNLFYIITKNIYFASFIAIIINEVVFKLPATFLMKRNISKNTLIDEKFFN